MGAAGCTARCLGQEYESVTTADCKPDALDTACCKDPEDFARIADHLGSAGCETGLEAVPPALRGIRLSQLEALNRAFVKTGWLRQRCEEACVKRVPSAKAARLADASEENMYALDTFVVRPVTHPAADVWRQGVPLWALQDAGIPPPPKQPCSYSQLVNPSGLYVDFFVSHYWGHPFKKTLKSLVLFSEDTHKSVGHEQAVDVVYWICLFALNQHQVIDELASSPEAAPFNIALMKSRAGVVMVLDERATPFSRVWCLYEVSRAHSLSQPFHVVTDKGILGSCKGHAREISEAVAESLAKMSAFEATSSSVDDKYAIWFRIIDKAWSAMFEDAQSFRTFLEGSTERAVVLPIDKACFSTFDSKAREILATPLLQLSLREGSAKAAIQYLGMGARCTVADLSAIEAMGQSLKKPFNVHFCGMDGTMPLAWRMARQGWTEELKFLLERKAAVDERADLRGASSLIQQIITSTTPLMMACWGGHLTAVKLLLDHKAAHDARSGTGLQPLAYASAVPSPDSAAIGAMLVQRGARIDDDSGGKGKAIHWAAGCNNVEMLALLLEQRADPDSSCLGDWGMPLHIAASSGLTKAARLLLERGADVDAPKDGNHPLHLAAAIGHRRMVALLMQHGAKAQLKDKNGKTPAEVASINAHTELATLMGGCKMSNLSRAESTVSTCSAVD